MTELELESRVAVQKERRARDAARKERLRHERNVRIIAAAVILLAFLAGYIGAALWQTWRENAESGDAGAETEIAAAYMAAVLPPELEESPMETSGKILESVPLSAEIQQRIFAVCDGNKSTFCTLMAIAKQESNFDVNAVGDGGKSLGIFQINTRWHTERMEKLGVTDLTDPVECAWVALDYLGDLAAEDDLDGHGMLMAYNMGLSGARKLLKQGVTSTAYSRSVMKSAAEYWTEIDLECLAELAGAECWVRMEVTG